MSTNNAVYEVNSSSLLFGGITEKASTEARLRDKNGVEPVTYQEPHPAVV
jgi:hypothetical protein